MRRISDPERYRAVLFDQRGCGRSTPHASDPATNMRHNTTDHLVREMELLREHLGIDRWLLTGGSWGATLALVYAQRHPRRVSEIMLSAISTTRRSEIDWLYSGVGRFFPEEWERFRRGAAGASRDDDLVVAYARLIEDPDPQVRNQAARNWRIRVSAASRSACRWASELVSCRSSRSCAALRSASSCSADAAI